jgi:hypothetical protein
VSKAEEEELPQGLGQQGPAGTLVNVCDAVRGLGGLTESGVLGVLEHERSQAEDNSPPLTGTVVPDARANGCHTDGPVRKTRPVITTTTGSLETAQEGVRFFSEL